MSHSDLAPATLEGAKTHPDRRSCRRFPATELKVELRNKTGVFSCQWHEVYTVDYNKKGFAFVTHEAYEEGQALVFRITLLMEMGTIEVDNVRAVTRNHYPEVEHTDHGNKRIGVAFDYQANRHMKSLDTQSNLGRIEGILERSENLRLKLSAQ